jgi:predicted Kef-type K+ transport protein
MQMKTDLSFLHISAFTLLGIAVIVGFYMGHVAQRIRLPSLIGYMIFGVILGPSILSLIDEPMRSPWGLSPSRLVRNSACRL